MRKWFKKEKAPFSELEEHPCPNCDHVFAGYYCPNCGQSVNEFDRPFGFVFYDFLGNFISFDSRFWKSFWNLLVRPGFLTNEFFRGKRQTYAPPFRIFIFLSFILFLLLQVATQRSLNKALDYSFQDIPVLSDSLTTSQADSLGLSIDITDELDSSKTVDLGFDFLKLIKGENVNTSLLTIADTFEKRLKTTTDKSSRRTLIKIIEICRSPEQLTTRILKYLSWAFFILLPVFALLMKLFYIRSKTNYIRHLVFSVHFHSFLFLIFTIIIAVNLIFNGDWTLYAFMLVFFIPVYFFIALKSYYKQGIIKTFLKGTLVSIIYNLIVLIAFSYVVMNAISNI